MADVPIERDNPLVRRLNAVAEVNAQMGTALGGGARPPRAGSVEGGRATVLPPAPRPRAVRQASQQLLVCRLVALLRLKQEGLQVDASVRAGARGRVRVGSSRRP